MSSVRPITLPPPDPAPAEILEHVRGRSASAHIAAVGRIRPRSSADLPVVTWHAGADVVVTDVLVMRRDRRGR